MSLEDRFTNLVEQHIELFSRISEISTPVIEAGELMASTLKDKRKILACGNGGSAADAQHFAAEIVGRFEKERMPLPAIALTTDTSILTAVGNDYGFDTVFARQVQGLSTEGDVLLGISTSGNSPNVIQAVEVAKECGVKTVCLLGNEGGKLASACDIPIVVKHPVTARIQEVHIFILHFLATVVDIHFTEE